MCWSLQETLCSSLLVLETVPWILDDGWVPHQISSEKVYLNDVNRISWPGMQAQIHGLKSGNDFQHGSYSHVSGYEGEKRHCS